MEKNAKTYYPLTYPQKGIWQIEQLHPHTGIGNIPSTLKVEKDLDFDILEKAVNLLIQRNEGLRIRILEQNQKPMQYVADYKYYKVDFLDFRGQELEKVYEWDTTTAKEPFPLIDNDLFYFALFKCNENRSGLYIKTHHLISDAWTLVNMANEIMAYYLMIEKGQEIIEEQKPSYMEYIESEKAYLKSEKYEKEAAYWQAKFDETFELAVLKPRKSNIEHLKAHRKTFVIPAKLSAKIREHCRENNTTIFALFFAALSLYINRTTGKENITIGVPVLNRTNKREKRTVGMFISVVPLSIKIDYDMHFVAFSKQVMSEWMQALRHQRFPYEDILKHVRQKNKGIDKLYDIVISYQNAKINQENTDIKLEGRWHFIGAQTESMNIHINDRDDDGNLVVDYDYLTDMFRAKEIEFIHDHIIRLLWHALDNPAKKISKIHIVSEKELNNLLYAFNDVQAEYPKQGTLHQLFEAQVKKTPDHIAVICDNVQMTYAQINKKANQVARKLRTAGVLPNSIVGIMMNRSPQLIIGILAIIKAGGCYLPMDPTYPADRIGYLLEDSRAGILLTQNETMGLTHFDGTIINVDDPAVALQDEWDLENANKPSDLAYIIYTSGSTGMPKGVMIEHGNVVPLLFNERFRFAFDENDVWSMFHSACFDFSVWEMYGALLRGGKLVIIPQSAARNPEEFLAILKKNKVTVVNQITSPFYNLIQTEMQTFDCSLCLRYVLFGGETPNFSLLQPMMERYPNTKFITVYGITETTVLDTSKEVTEEEIRLNINNIGKPFSTVGMYILDKNLNILPIGIMGELCVGGPGVARGYLNKPELTAARFVPNPFVEGEKIYRSGDYARWFPKGEIEYLGRMDNQVKIRGFRIELGEIEKQLLTFKGVSKAVAVAKEDALGKKALCAYLVAEQDVKVTDIREYLHNKLPHYMVPACFVMMDALPLTSSGKVDVKALPNPVFLSEIKYAPPTNEIEKIMVDIWQSILNIENIGIDDNFFELGGDSLTTVHFLSKLSQYHLKTKIQNLYDFPTIRGLSSTVVAENQQEESFLEPKKQEKKQTDNASVRLESTPLTERILAGDLPPLNAVAISYIPDDFALLHGQENANALLKTFGDQPMLYHTISGELGRIGLVIIPMFAHTIYADKDRLVKQCVESIALAESLGAKAVSLTGLIPSATNYGADILKSARDKGLHAHITTGHTTTAASVILSIKRLLKESGRSMIDEKLCIVGAGSVGTTVMKLLLTVLPHPMSVTLCDIQEKELDLNKLKKELRDVYGYQKDIRVALAKGRFLPDEIYENTIFVGATNVPDVLEVGKLQSGTMIIDDSGPHCFSKETAIQRLQTQGDILFTEGGMLAAPAPFEKITYLPAFMNAAFVERYEQHFLRAGEITGCIYSSLLSAVDQALTPSIGLADVAECTKHYLKLSDLGFTGAGLHCDEYVLLQEHIQAFRKAFGGND